MKRYTDVGGEATSERLTDALIGQANAIVDKNMAGENEDQERYCHISGKHYEGYFSISCSTRYEMISFRFKLLDDGSIEYLSKYGCYRD